MIDKFFFRTVLNFVCWLLLFMYRQCAIASVCFGLIICVFTNVALTNPYWFHLDKKQFILLLFRIHEFYFAFFSFVFCLGCVIIIILLLSRNWSKNQYYFFVTLFIYIMTLILFFFLLPVIQSA
jgi:hypothetical protein